MIAARDCKDLTDLKARLDTIQIFDEPINFNLSKLRLDPEDDPLDQYIMNNMFPPLDMKYCPFCFEEIISQDDDNMGRPAHLENVHNKNEKNLMKIFLVLQYGLPLFNYAFFPL
jgi:hypothetical protein